MRSAIILLCIGAASAVAVEPGFRTFDAKAVKEVRFATAGGRVLQDFDKVKFDIARRVTGLLAGGAMPTVWIDGKPLKVGDRIECKISAVADVAGKPRASGGIKPLTSLMLAAEQAAEAERGAVIASRQTALNFQIAEIAPHRLLLQSETNEPLAVDLDVQAAPGAKAGMRPIAPDEFVVATGVVVHADGYVLAPISRPSGAELHAYGALGRVRLEVVKWDEATGVALLRMEQPSAATVLPSTVESAAEVTLHGCAVPGAVPVVFRGAMPSGDGFALPREVLPGAAMLDADGRLLGLTAPDAKGYRSIPVSRLGTLLAQLPSPTTGGDEGHLWHDYTVLIARRG